MKHPKRFTPLLLTLGVLMGASVAGYLAIRGLNQDPRPPIWYVPGGDAAEGRRLIGKYGCGACHVIPGVRGAAGKVGPDLTAFNRRIYIGGETTNEPANLIRWIEDPQAIAPGSAMPDLGVSESEARDIAAYLYTLD
jgi:cytochrome c2